MIQLGELARPNALCLHRRRASVLLPQQDMASSGVGEAPQSGVGAGVANAFFDATGVRMRSSPLSPPRVRAALKDAGVA